MHTDTQTGTKNSQVFFFFFFSTCYPVVLLNREEMSLIGVVSSLPAVLWWWSWWRCCPRTFSFLWLKMEGWWTEWLKRGSRKVPPNLPPLWLYISRCFGERERNRLIMLAEKLTSLPLLPITSSQLAALANSSTLSSVLIQRCTLSLSHLKKREAVCSIILIGLVATDTKLADWLPNWINEQADRGKWWMHLGRCSARHSFIHSLTHSIGDIVIAQCQRKWKWCWKLEEKSSRLAKKSRQKSFS